MSKSAKTESRVSSVSLDQETWEIAKSMPNFSSFVRECLIRWRYEAQVDKSRHLHPMQIGRNPRTNHIEYTVCYPHSKLGLCLLCWPEGAPTSTDWVEWVQGWRYDHHRGTLGAGKPITHIQTLAGENNTREAFHMTEFDFKRKNSVKAGKVGQGRKWARILAVLRFWD